MIGRLSSSSSRSEPALRCSRMMGVFPKVFESAATLRSCADAGGSRPPAHEKMEGNSSRKVKHSFGPEEWCGIIAVEPKRGPLAYLQMTCKELERKDSGEEGTSVINQARQGMKMVLRCRS